MRFTEFIKGGLIQTWRRFPTVSLTTIFAVIIGFVFVHMTRNYDDDNRNLLDNLSFILILCNLSALLALSFDLYCEKNKKSAGVKWALRIISILLGVVLFFTLDFYGKETNVIKVMAMCVAAHFAVASFPFIHEKSWQGFWDFNKELYLRILLSAFYSGVIYLGLTLAVLAQDKLLGLYEDPDVYGYLAILIFIGFNTLFFISGIPKLEDSENEEKVAYPYGLKIFAGYVILPLVAIYMLILLLFEMKILITNDFPEGFVSWMIFCFAVAGILAFLLLYPIIGNKENKWIKISLRVFSFSLLPLLILLWYAIIIRLKDYGWTEMRYIHASLSVWLTFFVFYFLIKNNNVSIKWLPLSLAILGFFISFGPWGFSFISKKSQKSYIDSYVATMDSSMAIHIDDKIDYLIDNHGVETVLEYVNEIGKRELDILNESSHYRRSTYETKSIVRSNLNFTIPDDIRNPYNYNNNWNANINLQKNLTSVAGYQYILNLLETSDSVVYEDLQLKISLNYEGVYEFTFKGKKETINIHEYIKKHGDIFFKYANKDYQMINSLSENDRKHLEFEIFDGDIKVIITKIDINFDKTKTVIDIYRYGGVVMIK